MGKKIALLFLIILNILIFKVSIVNAAVIGEKKVLFIMVQFNDDKFQTEHNFNYYNTQVITEFKSYWETVSYGKFKISSSSKLVDAGTLNKNQADYGANTASGADVDWDGFVTDTRNKAATVLSGQQDSIANYEKVIIIHAGHSEQDSGGSPDKLATAAENLNGVNAIFSEFDILNGNQVWIYTMAHEFGHLIGLPDNYDYQIDSQPAYTGSYGLMGYQWNGATPTAVDKISLGWVNIIDVTSSTLVLKASEFLDSSSNNVYRIDIPGSGEYMIEAKEKSQEKFDPAIGSGILIYYHDTSIPPTFGNVYRQTILLTPDNDIYPWDFDIYSNDEWKKRGQAVAPSKFNANILDKWGEEIVEPLNQIAFSFREASVKSGQFSGIPNDHQYILDIATANLNPNYELNEFKIGTASAKNVLGLDVGKVKYITTSNFFLQSSNTFELRTGLYTDIWAGIGWTTKYQFQSTIQYPKIGNFDEKATYWEMQNTSKENWPALPNPYSGNINFGTPLDTSDWKLIYNSTSLYWSTKLERKTEIERKERIRWTIRIPKALSQTIPEYIYPSFQYDIQGNFYSPLSSGSVHDYPTSSVTIPRNLEITINEPNSLIDVGNPTSPNHFVARFTTLPNLIKEQIAVKVGIKYADYSLTENSGSYLLDVAPPPQDSEGIYDLIVEVKVAGNLYTKNGGTLIRYTGPKPPSISNIYHSPSSPSSSDSVNIYAGVSDSDGVSTVEAKWSLDQSFSNTITMTDIGGATYKTSSSIPVQSTGTTVYYKVCASDTKGNSGCSSVYSYTVGVSNQAPAVGVPSLSPNPSYQGQTVSVSASVTDPNGNSDISTVTTKVQNGAGYIFTQSTLSYDSGTGTASGSIIAPSQISNDYYVVVTATDKSGLQGSNQQQLTVKESPSVCTPMKSSLDGLYSQYSKTADYTSNGVMLSPSSNVFIGVEAILVPSNTTQNQSLSSDNLTNIGAYIVPIPESKRNTTSSLISASESVTIVDKTTSKDVQTTSPWDPIDRTTVFSPTDAVSYTWLRFTDMYEGHTIKWEWYKPDNGFYTDCTATFATPDPGYYYPDPRAWCGIYVNGYSAANYEGLWTVKIYVDGSYRTSLQFNIKYILTDHTMTTGHDSNYNPVDRVSSFSRTTEKMESWLRVDDVPVSLTFKWDWYEPSGSLHTTGSTISADPKAQGYDYWANVKAWMYVCLAGYPPADKPGQWEVKVYIDDEHKYSEAFTVIDDLAPSIGVSHAPQNPTDQDSVSITVGANDNVGLSKVELYWNDGTWHTETWTSPSNPFSGTKDLGILGCGKTIQYYAIAYDTSGNSKQTSTYSFSTSDSSNPSISASHSPSNPTDKDVVTLTISAGDNCKLDKVELYWNNGTLQIQTWYPTSNSFSQNYNIGPFEGSTVVQYYAKSYDASSKLSTTYTYSFTVSDTTPPPKPSPKAHPSDWTNDNTPTIYNYVVVDYGGGVKYYEYQIDSTNGSWTNIGTTPSFEVPPQTDGTHIVFMRAVDNANLLSEIGNVSIYVDTSNPGVTSFVSPVGLTNDSTPRISWNTVNDEGSGVAGYEYAIDQITSWTDLGNVTSFDAPTLSDGTHTIYVRAYDQAGNRGNYGSTNISIDTVKPSTAIFPASSNAWYASVQTITLNVGSDASGIAGTYYKIDDGAKQTYSAPFATSEGSHTYTYWSVDKAGNVEDAKTATIKVDSDGAPTVSITNPTSSAFIYGRPSGTVYVNYSYRENNPASVKIEVFKGATIIGITTIASLGSGSSSRNDGVVLDTNVADGNYDIRVNITDQPGNSSVDIETNAIIIDSIAPNLVYMKRPSNNSKFRGATSIEVDANDALSGIERVELLANGMPIGNATTLFSSYSYIWNTTLHPDGEYLLTARAYDKAGNTNTSELVYVTVDNTPPSITSLKLNPSIAGANETVNITVNADDMNAVDTVLAELWYPNGSSIIIRLHPGSAYKSNFNDTPHYGKYFVAIIANDTIGNVNNTEKSFFLVARKFSNSSIIAKPNESVTINASDANTVLEIATSGDASGFIEIVDSSVNLPETSNLSIPALGRYIKLNVSNDLENKLTWAIIKIAYTNDEVSASGLDENSLSLYWWNESSSQWVKLSKGKPDWVNDVGVNITENFVWANVSRFSYYSIGGELYVPPTQPSAPAGGGGGGGGLPPALSEGIQNLDLDLLDSIIKELGLGGKVFYKMVNALAPIYALMGDVTGEWPAPEFDISKMLTKPITELEGDVYELAVARVKKRWVSAPAVVIARGDLEMDSMAAVAYAKARGIPMLLTKPDELPSIVQMAVKGLSASNIIIAGGPVAVSKEVESKLASMSPVERIAGNNREETAVELAKALEKVKVIDTIVVANSLNAAPETVIIAASYRAPILYVAGDTVPQTTRDFLADHKVTKGAYRKQMKVVLVGMSEKAQKQIDQIMQ